MSTTPSRFLSFERGPIHQRTPRVHVLNFMDNRVPLHPPLASGATIKPGLPVSKNELKRRQQRHFTATQLQNFFNSRRLHA